MAEYDLAVVGILWGSTLAFALAAVTMVDSGRKKLLIVLWAIAGAFLLSSITWPFLAEQWPALKGATEHVAANRLVLNLLGTVIFGLLVFDFWLRSKRHKSVSSLDQHVHPTNEALNNGLQGLFERVGKLELAPDAASAEDQNTLRASLQKLMNEHYTLAGETVQRKQIDRDIMLLLNYALYQSAQLLLGLLLDAAPVDDLDSPLHLGGSFQSEHEEKIKFLDLVRRKLDAGADRRGRFESVMRNAEYFAEQEVEQTPMDQRPSGIDPLVLRKWSIVHRQCTRAVAFLKHERREVEETLLSQRHSLLERYSEKDA